jgi:hypothetical protein
VNGTVLLVPPFVCTETCRCPGAALEAITKFAVTVVPELPTAVTELTVIPPPGIWKTELPVRFFPVTVTLTVVPGFPLEGLMLESEGGVALTVKVTAALVPADVDTLTL